MSLSSGVGRGSTWELDGEVEAVEEVADLPLEVVLVVADVVAVAVPASF